jgi:hypothetical protein
MKEAMTVHTAPAGNFFFKWSDDFCCFALCAVPKRIDAINPSACWFVPAEPRVLE